MSKFLKFKKINVLKLAFITSAIYGILSLCIFVIVGIFSLIMGNPTGLVLMVVAPILYAIGGFISGLISGYIYNLVSKKIGGIEFEVEEIEKFSE